MQYNYKIKYISNLLISYGFVKQILNFKEIWPFSINAFPWPIMQKPILLPQCQFLHDFFF